MKRKGRQVDLGSGLGNLVSRLDRKSGGAYIQSQVATLWTEIAGPAVASHTAKAFLSDGELRVLVDSPVWATELSALAEQYRVRMNEGLGREAVTSVRFSVSREVVKERRFEQVEREVARYIDEDKVDSIPLTAEEMARVEDSVKAIEDNGLREAALRATIADLEWKKGLSARKTR